MIFYLHGLRFTPVSWKVRALREHPAARGLAAAFWCERLPVPRKAAI